MFNFWSGFFLAEPDLSGLETGPAGEEWVAYLYRRGGHSLLARNYEVYSGKKLGELDIVCVRKNTLIIVEVRTRRSESFISIAETVNQRKRQLLRRMAKVYLSSHPEFDRHYIRIDVAAVLMDPFDNSVKRVNIIENAIEDA